MSGRRLVGYSYRAQPDGKSGNSGDTIACTLRCTSGVSGTRCSSDSSFRSCAYADASWLFSV